jgi:hypothetical protein
MSLSHYRMRRMRQVPTKADDDSCGPSAVKSLPGPSVGERRSEEIAERHRISLLSLILIDQAVLFPAPHHQTLSSCSLPGF